MGLEATCILISGAKETNAHLHLDSRELTIRTDQRAVIPLGEIASVAVRPGGVLQIQARSGAFRLRMSDRFTAEKWHRKIRSPKSRLEKLGVKRDSRVAVIDVIDDSFQRELAGCRASGLQSSRASALDFVFYAADSKRALARLPALKKKLAPTGAIWVVSLKGKAARIKDTDVMHAAAAAGLVDIKVCGFSETHTALKLVVPLADRK